MWAFKFNASLIPWRKIILISKHNHEYQGFMALQHLLIVVFQRPCSKRKLVGNPTYCATVHATGPSEDALNYGVTN